MFNVTVEQEEKLCGEVETVRKLTYCGVRVSAGGRCEAAVTVRRRCGWVKVSLRSAADVI